VASEDCILEITLMSLTHRLSFHQDFGELYSLESEDLIVFTDFRGGDRPNELLLDSSIRFSLEPEVIVDIPNEGRYAMEGYAKPENDGLLITVEGKTLFLNNRFELKQVEGKYVGTQFFWSAGEKEFTIDPMLDEIVPTKFVLDDHGILEIDYGGYLLRRIEGDIYMLETDNLTTPIGVLSGPLIRKDVVYLAFHDGHWRRIVGITVRQRRLTFILDGGKFLVTYATAVVKSKTEHLPRVKPWPILV